MFITKLALPRRTFLRGDRHGAGAAAARRDGAGAVGARRHAAAVRRRVLASSTCRTAWRRTRPASTTGRRRGEGRNFELSQILTPLAPFRDRMVVVSGLDHNQAETGNDGASGDHTRGTSSWLTGVLSQAHRRRRRPQRHLRRSDCGVGPRQGHGAAVARARHRSQFPGRPVREQLQLRLPEHAGVDLADDAAADREQSARRVRAAVRRRRHGGAARRAGAPEPSILDSVLDDFTRLQRRLGPGRSHGRRRSTSIRFARSSGASRASRSARTTSCRRSSVRRACRSGSTST